MIIVPLKVDTTSSNDIDDIDKQWHISEGLFRLKRHSTSEELNDEPQLIEGFRFSRLPRTYIRTHQSDFGAREKIEFLLWVAVKRGRSYKTEYHSAKESHVEVLCSVKISGMCWWIEGLQIFPALLRGTCMTDGAQPSLSLRSGLSKANLDKKMFRERESITNWASEASLLQSSFVSSMLHYSIAQKCRALPQVKRFL